MCITKKKTDLCNIKFAILLLTAQNVLACVAFVKHHAHFCNELRGRQSFPKTVYKTN